MRSQIDRPTDACDPVQKISISPQNQILSGWTAFSILCPPYSLWTVARRSHLILPLGATAISYRSCWRPTATINYFADDLFKSAANRIANRIADFAS